MLPLLLGSWALSALSAPVLDLWHLEVLQPLLVLPRPEPGNQPGLQGCGLVLKVKYYLFYNFFKFCCDCCHLSRIMLTQEGASQEGLRDPEELARWAEGRRGRCPLTICWGQCVAVVGWPVPRRAEGALVTPLSCAGPKWVCAEAGRTWLSCGCHSMAWLALPTDLGWWCVCGWRCRVAPCDSSPWFQTC